MMSGLILSAACLASASVTQADTVVDLTSSFTSGSINGAIYGNNLIRPAGSGVIDSFLRVGGNATAVSGYNTTAASASGEAGQRDEHPSDTFTHEITIGDIASVTSGGIDYYVFQLDINQTGSDPLLSLVDIQIYTSAVSHAGAYQATLSNLGSLVYSMDASPDGDGRVDLNYDFASGSGQSDMAMMVPVSFFGGAGAGTFVYLYSAFGGIGDEPPHQNNDGYEEWFNQDVTLIPLPQASVAGLATFGIVLGGRLSRRRRA